MYKTSIENLKTMSINISDEFFSQNPLDVPLLKGVQTLLNSISTKGLKLTGKGYLPTKVVKSITEVASTQDDKRYEHLQKRFYENEHMSAGLARAVTEVLKLTKKQKGYLLLTKKAQKFLSLNEHEQYIIIFNIMLGINLNYFDMHQEAICVHNSSIIMLQLLRDKEKGFRPTKAYIALLLKMYPMLEDDILMLEPPNYGNMDQFDEFVHIAELRLFERLFLPLNLVEMQAKTHLEDDLFAKSTLLDKLIPTKSAIDKDFILSKKVVKTLQDTIEQNSLELDLFETIMYLFAQYANLPLAPQDSVVELLCQKHLLIGTRKEKHKDVFYKIIQSVLITYEEFTQFDTIGINQESIMIEYINTIESLLDLVKSPKPFNTIKKIQILPAFILDILKLHYGLDMNTKDFILECTNIFGKEFATDVGQLIMLYNQLEKDARKLKKSKSHFQTGVKEFIQTYMSILFELRTKDIG